MGLEAIFGTTIELLGKNIDLRAKNHNFISANLANADTPGYRPTTLSFEGELRKTLRERGDSVTTHPRHIPLAGEAAGLNRLQGTVDEAAADLPGKDDNGVELDREMGKMVENQIKYNAAIQLLAQKFQGVKSAIKGGS